MPEEQFEDMKTFLRRIQKECMSGGDVIEIKSKEKQKDFP